MCEREREKRGREKDAKRESEKIRYPEKLIDMCILYIERRRKREGDREKGRNRETRDRAKMRKLDNLVNI